jgi:CheY-like chemotaxis protein
VQTSFAPSGKPAARTILVLDDEPAVQHVLQRWLEKTGFASVHAASVAELNAAASTHAIDAFILDMNLEGPHSGLDVLTWLRQQPAYGDSLVVVLTGMTELDEGEKAIVRNHRAYVFYKGQSLKPLMDHLQRLLANAD